MSLNSNFEVRGDTLLTRETSGFPLSVATGLSFQSLFSATEPVIDPDRIVPEHVNFGKYSEIWINVTTLFRNISTSINKTAFVASTPAEFKDAVLMEMGVIDGLFQNEGLGLCKPRYYYTQHAKLISRFPEQVKSREEKTDLQEAYNAKLVETLKLLDKETEVIHRFDETLNVNGYPSALIFTHIPYDLLSYPKFTKLTLLESHTGVTKEKNRWYTKYYPVGKEDLSHLPFLRKLLLVFGDRVLIHPGVMALRKQIVEIGKNRQWTPTTTESKVMMDLSLDIKEPYVLMFLKAL